MKTQMISTCLKMRNVYAVVWDTSTFLWEEKLLQWSSAKKTTTRTDINNESVLIH